MFTPEDVADLARLNDVDVPLADREEVAIRLSVMVAALQRINIDSLGIVDPSPLETVSAAPLT